MASSENAKVNDKSEASAEASGPMASVEGVKSKTGAEPGDGKAASTVEPVTRKATSKTKDGKASGTSAAASSQANAKDKAAVGEQKVTSKKTGKSSGVATANKAAETKGGRSKPMVSKPSAITKSETVLKLLRSSKGVSIQAMMEATGWQAHSVRGFLSATVKKKLGLTLTSETGKDGIRRYKVA